MSIKKISPGLWAIKVCVRVPGVTNPITKREKFAGTKVEAQCREAEIINTLKSTGRSLTVMKLNDIKTFSDAISLRVEYLKVKGTFASTTARQYACVDRMFGHLPIFQVPDHLHQYRVHTEVDGSTKNGYTAKVKATFGRLVELEMIEKNPITKTHFPKYQTKHRERVLTPDEQVRLFKSIAETEPHILPIVKFMCLVPCRVSELTTARREQYLPIQQMIYIPDSKAKIPIMKPIPDEMKEYFQNLPEECPWLFYKKFNNGKYKPLRDFWKAWNRCLVKAGIEDLRRHDLRHHSVTTLSNLGNTVTDIMAIAGWKTDMMRTYYHRDIVTSAQNIKFQKIDLPMSLSKTG